MNGEWTVERLLEELQEKVDSLRTPNRFGGHDYESWSDKQECEKLLKTIETIDEFMEGWSK